MKRILILLLVTLILTGCKNEEQTITNERKTTISEQETLEYLSRLLDPYIKTSNIETDDQVYDVLEEIDSNSTEIMRELKKDYEKNIHAVDDLIELSEVLIKLGNITEDEMILIKDYSDEIVYHIYNISTEYLDGEIPDNYAKVLGVKNLYDLK